MTKKKTIFLDRDGVINQDRGYVCRWQDFEFLEGAINGIKRLGEAEYLLIIVTNQSGIGRGYYSEEDFLKLTRHMLDHLSAYGVHIDAVYHCPHAPESNCVCRKPAPGLIWRAQENHAIDLMNSVIVGDKMTDLEAGRRAGVGYGILITEGAQLIKSEPAPHGFAQNLTAAADLILSKSMGS